jgi:hypothetical protein
MPTFLAGHEPSAAEYAALLPIFARKTSDESLTSSTTLQNDDALFVSSMDAAGIYEVHLHALIKSNNATNGGMKTTFTLPTGADFTNAIFDLNNASRSPASTGTINGIALTTTNGILTIDGLLVMDGTHTGTFQFQWAQNSSSANTSVVSSGSYLTLRRVA